MGSKAQPDQTSQTKQIELEIVALSSEGQGIGRLEGLAVFVPGALPGERILAKIVAQKKNYAQARLLSVLTPASGRQLPHCRYYEQCGGCQLQHLTYPGQLAAKRQWVQDALDRIAGISNVKVAPVLGMKAPWRYRSRGRIHLSWHKGQAKAGFFAQGSHTLIPVEDCLLFPETFALVAQSIARDLSRVASLSQNANAVRLVNGAKDTGLENIKSLVLRQNKEGRIMLILEGETSADLLQDMAAGWQQEFPQLQSILQNYGQKSHTQGWAAKWRTLAGPDILIDKICGCRFLFSPTSFVQVNAAQTQVLYEQVCRFAQIVPGDILWDIYCGVGTIGIVLAKAGAKLWGVEEDPSAILMARKNAALNGVDAIFEAGRAELILPKAYQKQGVPPQAVVIDPPRSGCKPEVLKAIAEGKVPKIIYVSCHPGTLARDARLLSDLGYTVSHVQPVDMFPHSHHVETCVLLSHKNPQTSPPSL